MPVLPYGPSGSPPKGPEPENICDPGGAVWHPVPICVHLRCLRKMQRHEVAASEQSTLNVEAQSAFDTQSTATEAELATALREINAEITEMKKIAAQQSNSPRTINFQIQK